MTDEEQREYLVESLFLNTVTYENERLGALIKKLPSEAEERLSAAALTRPRRRRRISTALRPRRMSLNYLATRFRCSWPWETAVLLCDGRLVCGCADPYAKRVLGDTRTTTVERCLARRNRVAAARAI